MLAPQFGKESQPEYVAIHPDSDMKHSLSIINMLQTQTLKDIQIGGNVKFCIFDLRPKLSSKKIVDKCSLLLYSKKRSFKKDTKRIEKNKQALKH